MSRQGITDERLAQLRQLAAIATPGPWRSDGVRIGADADRILAVVSGASGVPPRIGPREANANAHLMAAARELLDEVVLWHTLEVTVDLETVRAQQAHLPKRQP